MCSDAHSITLKCVFKNAVEHFKRHETMKHESIVLAKECIF